jgi:hypothetical protein
MSRCRCIENIWLGGKVCVCVCVYTCTDVCVTENEVNPKRSIALQIQRFANVHSASLATFLKVEFFKVKFTWEERNNQKRGHIREMQGRNAQLWKWKWWNGRSWWRGLTPLPSGFMGGSGLAWWNKAGRVAGGPETKKLKPRDWLGAASHPVQSLLRGRGSAL